MLSVREIDAIFSKKFFTNGSTFRREKYRFFGEDRRFLFTFSRNANGPVKISVSKIFLVPNVDVSHNLNQRIGH